MIAWTDGQGGDFEGLALAVSCLSQVGEVEFDLVGFDLKASAEGFEVGLLGGPELIEGFETPVFREAQVMVVFGVSQDVASE